MRAQAVCLTTLFLAACSAQEPELRVMLATEAPVTSTAPAIVPPAEADLASEARAFFFGQTDLYLTGASAAADGPLADVMRAMGRDDLLDDVVEASFDNTCPQQWVEPIEMIARAAAESRIVIVESDRAAASQTAFVKELVTRLAADGFTAFADDRLTMGPGGPAHPDVLLVSEGLVTRDPGHGRLVREVKRSGLQLVDTGVWWKSSSELAALTPAEQSERRQEALALQVNRRIFAGNPRARVIVHTERSAGPDSAASLKEDLTGQTGHTPLHVVLTACSPVDARPALVRAPGENAPESEKADLLFAIPRAAIKEGRLTSGRSEGENLVAVPPAFLSADVPVLIEARRVTDPDLAVPEDRLLLLPGDRLPLLLSPGEYRIEAWTRSGAIAAPVAVSVS